jgi:hypothetical protein
MYVLYYASMLWCWQLVWILVSTNHPCLGVGSHKYDAYDMIKLRSMQNRNPTVSTNPIHAQTTASILTTVTSHQDRWKTTSLNNNTSQTQYHKDEKTCTTLMTAWLSITNQVWTQIWSMRLRYVTPSFKAKTECITFMCARIKFHT